VLIANSEILHKISPLQILRGFSYFYLPCNGWQNVKMRFSASNISNPGTREITKFCGKK